MKKAARECNGKMKEALPEKFARSFVKPSPILSICYLQAEYAMIFIL
jgi:hypothetical protein